MQLGLQDVECTSRGGRMARLQEHQQSDVMEEDIEDEKQEKEQNDSDKNCNEDEGENGEKNENQDKDWYNSEIRDKQEWW